MIVHRPNYHTTHMLQSMTDQLRAQGGVQRFQSAFSVLGGFRDAVKFVCPRNGVFFEDTNSLRYLELLKLPYPTVVLEYEGDLGRYHSAYARDPAIGVCVLATELRGMLRRIGEEVKPEDYDGVHVFVAYESAPHDWTLLPNWLFVPYSITPEDIANFQATGELRGMKCGMLDEELFKSTRWFVQNKTVDLEMQNQVANVLFRESLSVLQFCAAMGCANVAATERVPAPKFINKQRVAKGEVPLFEYHVLTVDTQHRSEHGDPKGGTHASPRQHLRRGHIRRYQTGLTIWIQPTTVGRAEHGVVKKDYRIKTWG